MVRRLTHLIFLVTVLAAIPSLVEAACSYPYTCRGCRNIGLAESGTSRSFPDFASCAAELTDARREASQPGMQNFTAHDCSCSDGGGSTGGYGAANQGAEALGAAIGEWLVRGLFGSPESKRRKAQALEQERQAIQGTYARLLRDYDRMGRERRYPDPGLRNSPAASASIEDAEATGAEIRDPDGAGQCPTGYVSNFNTRRFVGCCPADTPVLSIPQSFVLDDMICGTPEAIAAGVECLCYATATQCVDEGPGSLCGWTR